LKHLLPLLLALLLALSGCAPSAGSAPTRATLTIMAAASLSESFTELGQQFETQHPGVQVVFNFAGSQQLAQQLDQGAPADVFASASQKYMDAAVTSGRVEQDTPKTFVSNRLVVIFPKTNPAGLAKLQDLSKANIKMILAEKSVPAGQYSLEFLDKAVKDARFDASFKEAVLRNVVSYETDVKGVLSKVVLGEADAGIVYVTDFNSAREKLGTLEIPDALNSIATYPIAPVLDSKNAGLAKAFMALVLSPDGQAVMARHGFIPAVK